VATEKKQTSVPYTYTFIQQLVGTILNVTSARNDELNENNL